MTKDKRRSGATGLGKGLGGILGDALSADRAPEVSGLLGVAKVRRDPEVRKLVTELALESLAAGFGADGALIVARDADGELASVSSRLPSGWNTLEATAFESVGRLWKLLEEPASLRPDQADEAVGTSFSAQIPVEQITVGATSLLLCRCMAGSSPMAAAVLRSTPFDQREQQTVYRLVESVAVALHGDTSPPADAQIRVLTREAGEGILADVRVDDGSDRRNAASVAADQVTAVARAAAELCDTALSVEFAGQSRIQSCLVTVVTLTDELGGPLFGLAVSDPASSTGPVEAVFSAASVANYDPFVSIGDR